MTTTGSLTFTTAVRVIDRVHCDTANFRSQTLPTRTARFTKRYVFVLDVPNLAHSRFAYEGNASNLARWHTQLRVIPFLGNELRKRSGGTCHLPTLAWSQFNVVNLRSQRDID
jgi:hypothetical protein